MRGKFEGGRPGRGRIRRGVMLLILVVMTATIGCAETVRCSDGQVFDEDGECVDIRDGGATPDAAP